MKKEYIQTGKCIWCGRTKEDGATFYHIPHILPKAMGGIETCFDVCDECNSYYGDDRSEYGISQDEAVKGILQIAQHFLSLNPQREQSPLFNYFVKQHRITLKRSIKHLTEKGLTRQFQRGMCECFMQKYHYLTNDGNNPCFDKLRRFARYNEGNIPFYCVVNRILIHFPEQKHPIIGMSTQDITNIQKCGLYTCHILGHVIIMDVIPDASHKEKEKYCEDLMIINGITCYMEKLDCISKLDLFYTRFNGFQSTAISSDAAYLPFVVEPK